MSSQQVSPSAPAQPRSKKNSVVQEPPKFDLETYINNYTGRTRLIRLLVIGQHSAYLGVDALKFAVNEAKAGKDIDKYIQALTYLTTISPSDADAVRDPSWIERMTKENAAATERLENQLKGYKTNLIKESVRMGNEDLGNHYFAIGDLQRAFEAFNRMRTDIVVTEQLIDIGRHLIEVAAEQQSWGVVTSNIQKLRTSGISQEASLELQPFLMAAEGIAHLDQGNYYDAAISFVQANSGMTTSCNTIISPNDVAVYGGLCALATMDRNELSSKVLDSSSFRTYLELEPHIRQAITFFVNSRYSACLSILENYRTDYFLDIYLQKHIDWIYSLIRSKSIVQYFIPFSCVTLESMNQTFAQNGKSIEKELVQMIQMKTLDARIDTQNKLLVSVPSTPRGALHTQALETAKDYEREARSRIQHMNLYGADLDLKLQRSNRGAGGSFAEDFYNAGEGRELRSKGTFSHGGF